MRDCPMAEMRDALPDLMHGTLSPHQLAEVRAHLEACEACRAELELLERVRRAVPAPNVATVGMVSRLPRYQRPSRWRRVASGPVLRVAAAVVLLAGGVSLVMRDGTRVPEPVHGDSVPRHGATLELAVGETFTDVSDQALMALVEAMEDLDATTLSEEPESVTIPLAPVEGL